MELETAAPAAPVAPTTTTAAATAAGKQDKKLPHGGIYSTNFRDAISRHPRAREIDADILKRELSIGKIAEKWGLPGSWSVSRRRKYLAKQAQKAIERRKQKSMHRTEVRRGARTLELLEFPLMAAKEGFELAKAASELDTGATFLDKYMSAVKVFGELTGELGTPGQTNVSWQQNTMTIMSLPRNADTPEQIERAGRLGLPPVAGQVIDAQAVDPDEDEDYDDPEDPDDGDEDEEDDED